MVSIENRRLPAGVTGPELTYFVHSGRQVQTAEGSLADVHTIYVARLRDDVVVTVVGPVWTAKGHYSRARSGDNAYVVTKFPDWMKPVVDDARRTLGVEVPDRG